MGWRNLAFGLAALAVWIAAPAATRAAPASVTASFDCAKASTALEKAICSDATLAQEDRKLAATYAKTLNAIPAEWRERLRDTQRSWLAYMAIYCRPGDLPQREAGATIASCRRAEFKGRRDELERAIRRVGGLTFLAFVDYAVRPATSADVQAGDLPGSIRQRIETPQIALPTTSAQRQWNSAVAARVRRMADPKLPYSTDIEAFVTAASPDLIQLIVNESTPRPLGGDDIALTPFNWSLRLGRPLRLPDIFADTRAGEAALARIWLRDIRKEAAKAKEDLEVDVDTLRELARDPNRLTLERDGVGYAVGTEFGRGSQVERLGSAASWSELRPYLRKDLPFDPAALQSR